MQLDAVDNGVQIDLGEVQKLDLKLEFLVRETIWLESGRLGALAARGSVSELDLNSVDKS